MFVICHLRLNHNASKTWKSTSIWYNCKLQTVIAVCPVSDHHAKPTTTPNSLYKYISHATLCICIIMHELLYHPGVKDSEHAGAAASFPKHAWEREERKDGTHSQNEALSMSQVSRTRMFLMSLCSRSQ